MVYSWIDDTGLTNLGRCSLSTETVFWLSILRIKLSGYYLNIPITYVHGPKEGFDIFLSLVGKSLTFSMDLNIDRS